MENHLFIFGMGYTSGRLAHHLRGQGWRVTGTRRAADGRCLAFDDRDAVITAIRAATHILSSVPPGRDGSDPVLMHYAGAIANAPAIWTGYLSSTGVYGDAGGAWVDESTPVSGRRGARNASDIAWQNLRDDTYVFRLPGIYGPGRSALERAAQGKAHRIDLPDQVFSRVHVDDIVSGITASFAPANSAPGVYNLADDMPCGQNQVIEAACDMLGLPYPQMQSLEQAQLSPMALAFYAENRRVSNLKAKRLLGWQPIYATYRAGLAACMETSKPVTASTAPAAANPVH